VGQQAGGQRLPGQGFADCQAGRCHGFIWAVSQPGLGMPQLKGSELRLLYSQRLCLGGVQYGPGSDDVSVLLGLLFTATCF